MVLNHMYTYFIDTYVATTIAVPHIPKDSNGLRSYVDASGEAQFLISPPPIQGDGNTMQKWSTLIPNDQSTIGAMD